MSPAELSIFATALFGCIATLANLYFTNAKAKLVSEDLIRAREQDRLDREQAAKALIEAQKYELEISRFKAEAAAAEVKHKLSLASQDAAIKSEKLLKAVEDQRLEIKENTEITKQAAGRAQDAYHEANTVNLKLEKIGIDNVAEQHKRNVQEQKIGDAVEATEEKVEEVHEVVVKKPTRS